MVYFYNSAVTLKLPRPRKEIYIRNTNVNSYGGGGGGGGVLVPDRPNLSLIEN